MDDAAAVRAASASVLDCDRQRARSRVLAAANCRTFALRRTASHELHVADFVRPKMVQMLDGSNDDASFARVRSGQIGDNVVSPGANFDHRGPIERCIKTCKRCPGRPADLFDDAIMEEELPEHKRMADRPLRVRRILDRITDLQDSKCKACYILKSCHVSYRISDLQDVRMRR